MLGGEPLAYECDAYTPEGVDENFSCQKSVIEICTEKVTYK
jgi:hypothetical protein